MFAAAPRDFLRLGDVGFDRAKASAFVRAVAKRLGLRAPAGAPPVSARLGVLHEGRFLENDRFSHVMFVAAVCDRRK